MEVARSSTRSSHFTGCLSSPAWFGFSAEEAGVQQPPFQPLRRDNGGGAAFLERSRSWRRVLKRLLKEGKSMYSSKPVVAFGYDEDSYSKNFDDGCRDEALPDGMNFSDSRT